MRVGFYGGSFDPPHCGHLAVAKAAAKAFALDKSIFITAKIIGTETSQRSIVGRKS